MKIVLDIETIRCSEETLTLLPSIEPPAKSNGQDEEEWKANSLPKLKEKQHRETALDGTFGQIVCIGLLVFDEKKADYTGKVFFGTDEKKILKEFWSAIAGYGRPLFIAHNGLGFDLPFIQKRSIIKNVKPTHKLNLAKYRTDFIYDTMTVWANWEYKKNIKLDLLTKVLGVESKSGDGGSVFDKWSTGRYKDVAEYCFQDVYITYACYCRMNFMEIMNKTQIPVNFFEFSS